MSESLVLTSEKKMQVLWNRMLAGSLRINYPLMKFGACLSNYIVKRSHKQKCKNIDIFANVINFPIVIASHGFKFVFRSLYLKASL